MERIWQNIHTPSLSGNLQDNNSCPSIMPSAEQSCSTTHHEEEEWKETEEWQIEMEKICADIEGELSIGTGNSGISQQNTTAFLHGQSEFVSIFLFLSLLRYLFFHDYLAHQTAATGKRVKLPVLVLHTQVINIFSFPLDIDQICLTMILPGEEHVWRAQSDRLLFIQNLLEQCLSQTTVSDRQDQGERGWLLRTDITKDSWGPTQHMVGNLKNSDSPFI